MAVVTTKSTSIINLDSLPIAAMPIGEGATGFYRCSNDTLAAANGDSINSIYRLVRIPTNAKIKKVLLSATGITAGAGDVDVAFSDAPDLPAGLASFAGGVVQISGPADNKLFGAAQTLIAGTIGTNKDITFGNVFTFAMQNIPLWQVLANLGSTQFNNPVGSPVDPGGFFDIVIKLTTGITTAGTVALEVDYVE